MRDLRPWRSFTLPDLTPNPGLWWYFFTEMFDHFRPFFLSAFTVTMAVPARTTLAETSCIIDAHIDLRCSYMHQVQVSFRSCDRSSAQANREGCSHDPLYAAFLLQGVVATFKPYPTLADPGLFVSLFAVFPEVFLCKYCLGKGSRSPRLIIRDRSATSHRHHPPAYARRLALAIIPQPMAQSRDW
jgi:hypothetical protein